MIFEGCLLKHAGDRDPLSGALHFQKGQGRERERERERDGSCSGNDQIIPFE